MKSILSGTLILLSIVAAVSLACTINAGGPNPPGPPVPVSDQAVQELKQTWDNALIDPNNGQFAFTVTETQLTSLVAQQLQKRSQNIFRNPQVYLQNNQVTFFSQIEYQDMLTANSMVVIEIWLDANGKADLQIISADFGPIPASENMLQRVSSMLDEMLTGSLTELAARIQAEGFEAISGDPGDYIIFESIQISNGMLTVTGRKR